MSAAQHRGAPVDPFHAKRRLWLAMAFACTAIASGCGPPVLYDWGRYEESLQDNYVGHDEAKAFSGLEATITSAQQTGRRIPPGACAEYGFLLYKRGQRERAIEYFQREAQLFPESKPLMDKLAAKVREQASAEAQPPAGGSSIQ
jgi:hypothetical protein